jgi:hypothetical protein
MKGLQIGDCRFQIGSILRVPGNLRGPFNLKICTLKSAI